MRRGVGPLLVALVMLVPACLLDIAPPREPLDAVWEERMLSGQYGQWFHGTKSPYVGPDELQSWPAGASGTRHGIDIVEQSSLGGGGWSIVGGMVGRILQPSASIELFGKQTTRVHGMRRAAVDQDYSFEFFLVVRPRSTGRGRLVRRWRFSRNELARPPHEYPRRYAPPFAVDGFLTFDEPNRTATVSITGLARPFRTRVDLSRELDAPLERAVP